MIVVTLSVCPPSLKGDISKWLFEISPGVFVGNVSSRVRDKLWERILSGIRDGKATMVYPTRNEQKMQFRTTGTDWKIVDLDGIFLIERPASKSEKSIAGKETKKSSKPDKCLSPKTSVKAEPKENTELFPEKDFIAIDIETTGLDPDKDKILEIAAVKFVNGKSAKTFQTLISDAGDIPSFITELTGITEESLKSGIIEEEAIKNLIQFVSNYPVVFHNADFDLSFLQKAAERYGLSLNPVQVIDTLIISRKVKLSVENYRLKTLLKHFNINIDKLHSALSDAEATGELLLNLKKIMVS